MESGNVGAGQLAAMLTAYEWLSPQQQIDFIDAYRGTTTVHGQIPIKVVTHNTYQHDHVPPVYEP